MKQMEIRKTNKWFILLFLSVTVIFHYNWNFLKKNETKTYVILSSNLNYRYLFLLPFTVTLWKRIGVESIIVFSGSKKEFGENHQARETIKFLKEMNSTVIFLKPKHLSTTSFSQIIRLFGAVLPLPENILFSDEDILITSDVDLAVFNLSNHVPNVTNGKKIHLYNSNCCGFIKIPSSKSEIHVKMYPMGTIGATKKIWKEIMGFRSKQYSIGAIERYIIKEFGDNFFHSSDNKNVSLIGSPIWYADQSLFSYKFDSWTKKNTIKLFVSYYPNSPKRIDRIQWPTAKNFSQLNIQNFDDAHLPISAYSTKKWPKFLPFINFAFKDKNFLIQRLKDFRKSFCKFLAC